MPDGSGATLETVCGGREDSVVVVLRGRQGLKRDCMAFNRTVGTVRTATLYSVANLPPKYDPAMCQGLS